VPPMSYVQIVERCCGRSPGVTIIHNNGHDLSFVDHEFTGKRNLSFLEPDVFKLSESNVT